MKVKLTQEHIDAAIKTYYTSKTRVCGCCPIWQALRPLLPFEFHVGIESVCAYPFKLGRVGHLGSAGQAITLVPPCEWHTLKPMEFEYIKDEQPKA